MAKNIDISCAVAFLTQNQTNIGSRWKMWKKTFDVYLIAASGTPKNALLLHCGGEEIQEIYNTLPDPDPPIGDAYESIISVLKIFFLLATKQKV